MTREAKTALIIQNDAKHCRKDIPSAQMSKPVHADVILPRNQTKEFVKFLRGHFLFLTGD